MPEKNSSEAAEFASAFASYHQQAVIKSIELGCLIGILLMPAGVVLDYFVYHDLLIPFLKLRLLCSALIGLFWLAVRTAFGRRHYSAFGIVLAMFPASFITIMIYKTGGAPSPYYAGLNLVLLVVGFVLRWTFVESTVAFSLVLAMYLAACLGQKQVPMDIFVNNVYFLGLTGIIVMSGSFFHTRLRRQEFQLRFEVDRNRREIEAANEKLRELSQVKDRFFANISHELRTPLTLLISPIEVLLCQHGDRLNDKQRSLLETMHANAMRLLKMINDLLDLVRLESGRMEVKREPVEANELLRSLTTAAGQLAQEKRLELTARAGAGAGSFLADRDKLEKICLNLLFNAIKFTPGGGRIEFRAERRGEHLLLSVSDTGVGIAEKQLPFVFDRFWQADNSSKRKFKGVGIGLSLVKELVEVQGGSVSVQSEEGKGTTFTVQLPYVKADTPLPPVEKGTTLQPSHGTDSAVAPPHSEEWLAGLYRRAELFPVLGASASAETAKSPERESGRTLVLVADDEPSMVQFIASQVRAHYDVIEATDGHQAVELAKRHLPDIILLDMNMPEKDGLQVCRELRLHAATEKIPVILITARADEETKLASLSAGANDFLSKPFSVAELFVRIRNLVESHHYQKRLHHQKLTLEDAIEQLKSTETQLVQTAKMASLGRMSAGIIHEINNPLNFATTGLYTLRDKGTALPPEHQAEYAEILSDIEDGLKRVRNIVTDLRTFTHPDAEQADHVELAEVVGAAIRFLSSEWRGKVRIQSEVPEKLAVFGNKNRLIQVLLNLLQNSLDALRRKTFPSGETPAILIQAAEADGAVLLTLRDNGEGIEPANLDKIFDPFFTTKDVGEGMGLGLSICYRILQGSGAKISAASVRGEFTEFKLEFPPVLENQPTNAQDHHAVSV